MKKQSLKKFFVFIMALMIFSVLALQVNAQTSKGKKKPPPGGCNCFIRPIPFGCGQICGFLIDKPSVNKSFSISFINSNTMRFELEEVQNVSAKIFDARGRLVKTITNERMLEGYHDVKWNAKDETGNLMPAGTYFLRITTGNNVEMRKIFIVK